MEKNMKRLSKIFKGLSDDTRLTILGLVFRHGHLCVCEVERILGISQSKASRHLRYLRDAGVLEDERAGLIVNYRLPEEQDEEVGAVLEMLRNLLSSRSFPDAGPLLVQMRGARTEGEVAGATVGSVLVGEGSAS
jgi:ArsR family transcriptional regulator